MTEKARLKVEYVPTDSLVPYARNAKKHDVPGIVYSIEQTGFNDPVGVWENPETGELEIVEGHGRVLAAKRLKMAEVPIIRLDGLTDEQRRVYTHAHNQLTMVDGWEQDILDIDLAELGELFDLGKLGFSLPEPAAEVEPRPEVEFTEVLGEEHNYLVLTFDNAVDWINAQTVFGVKTVKNPSTRKDGKLSEKMATTGVGHVIDGAKAINAILGA